MSNEVLKYDGYIGSIDICLESYHLHGKLLFIEDTITYSSDSVAGLKAEFEEAVRDYKQTCAEVGKEPQQPFRGSFNIRIGEELHKAAAIQAKIVGVTLNEYVKTAIEEKVSGAKLSPIVQHVHNHKVVFSRSSIEAQFEGGEGEVEWQQETTGLQSYETLN